MKNINLSFKSLKGIAKLFYFFAIVGFTSIEVFSQTTFNPVVFTPQTNSEAPDGVFRIRGDFGMLGNKNLTAVNSNDLDNGFDTDMRYVDVDGVSSTVNSSSANFVFSNEGGLADPGCYEIVYAGLYWTGRTNTSTDDGDDATFTVGGTTLTKNQVKIRFGNGAYQTVTAKNTSEILFPDNDPNTLRGLYAGYADVTNFVKNNGAGTYTVADIFLRTTGVSNGGSTGLYGGWGMVVIYKNPTMNFRNISTFNGYSLVNQASSSSSSGEILVSGFEAIDQGPVNVKLGLMAGEGDKGISGDGFDIRNNANTNWVALSNGGPLNNGGNSTNNFFNSSIFTGGNPRVPNDNANYGLDLHVFDLPNANNVLIDNGDSQTRFRYRSQGDTYMIFNLTFAVDAYEPEIEAFHEVVSINNTTPAGTIKPGETAEFQVELTNKSTSEGITDGKLEVQIPFGATVESTGFSFNNTVTPSGNSAPSFDPNTGILTWVFGDLPLSSDVGLDLDDVLATLTYSLKATEDCLILFENSCIPDMNVDGVVTGTGAISQSSLNRDFIIDREPAQDQCSAPTGLTGPIEISYDTDGFQCDIITDFEFCAPKDEVTLAEIEAIYDFPDGYTFYNVADRNDQNAVEYTSQNPFPGAGTYYAFPFETDIFSGCYTEFTISIIPAPNLEITDPAAVCTPGTVDLTAAAVTAGSDADLTFTYWTDEGATVSLQNPAAVATSGTYYIRAENAAGCFVIEPVDVSIGECSLTLVKEATNGPTGEDCLDPTSSPNINYSFTLNNNGTFPLSNIQISDPLFEAPNPVVSLTLSNNGNGDAILDAGETWVYTASYAITATDIENGQVVNQATASGDFNGFEVSDLSGTAVDNDDQTIVPICQDEDFSIAKVADPQTYDAVGDVISYDITVTNDGNVTLEGILVEDPLTGLSQLITSLAPGADTVIVTEYTIVQGDLDAGQVDNTATATFGDLERTADETVTATQTPNLAITKEVTGNDDVLNGQVTYNITVTNTGNVTLFDVYVEDMQVGLMEVIAELAPGESEIFPVAVTITQELIDGVCFINTASAELREYFGQEIPDQGQEIPGIIDQIDYEVLLVVRDQAEACFTQDKSINIEKTSDLETSGEQDCFEVIAGETVITYTFTVTNTGNVSLSGVAVNDELEGLSAISFVGGDTDQDGELDVEETWTYEATYTVTQDDVDAGSIENTAEVTTDDETVSDEDRLIIELCQESGINIEKTSDLETSGEQDCFEVIAGETVITYTFTVTNTGNVSLSGVAVNDELEGLSAISFVGGDTDQDGELDVEETWTYEATYTVTQDDVDAGSIENTAEVTTDDETVSDEDRLIIELCQNPDISIIKAADPTSVDAAGQEVTYTLTVTNTGNTTLAGVTISDPLTGFSENIGSMVPGQVVVRETTYVVTQADIDNGSIVNVADVFAFSGQTQVSDEDDAVVEAIQLPSISMEKTADRTSVDAAGQEVTYTLTVTNTGNTTLAGVTISDPLTGFSENVGSMVPGQVVVRETTYVVTQADIDNGSIVNVADVFAFSGQTQVSDEDDAVVEAIQLPSINMDKTADPTSVDAAGQEVTYTLTVTNTGNTTLAGVTISDPLTGFSENVGSMVPGQVVVRETTYVVTQSDIDNGSIVNVADVFAFSGQTPVSDEDDAVVEAIRNPSIQVIKSDNGAQVSEAGDVITYTLTVTNTGNVTLTNVTVDDPLTGLNVNVGTLAPGASTSVDTDYVVTQADVDAGFVLNTAITTGESPEGEDDPEDETDIETPIEVVPGIAIVKSTDTESITQVGQEVDYTLTVTNTGNVTLTNVTVIDPLTGLDINLGSLAPSQTESITTTYTVAEEDVASTSLLNTATVSGTTPGENGTEVSDEDSVEITIDVEDEIIPQPEIDLVKTADVQSVSDAGDVITYTLTVTNTGNVDLFNVTINDGLINLDEVVDVLPAGETVTFTGNYTVTIEDLALGEAILNFASASGDTEDLSENVTDTDFTETPIVCDDWTLVTGIVYNALTDQPLPNVPITLIPQGDTSGETLIVITDAEGRYVFKDVPTGNYLIQVQDANLNAQGLFNFQKSSLAFREVEVCVPVVEDFPYAPFDGVVLGDFVWYDLNQDGIQNEWFDANNDGQVTMNDLSAGPISISEWEWFDLNGDGRYDGPENEGELNKAGLAGTTDGGNIRVTGPNGYDANVIVGILGYWRERPGATEDDMFDDQGGAIYGDYTAVITADPVLTASASAMAATGLVKNLPNEGGRMTDINSIRFEERCGLTTDDTVSRTVSSDSRVHLDMDFGWVCVQAEVEIIANDDDFGDYFVSYGGLLGNILDNDLLEGERPDPADVDFEFTELDGVIGLLIDDNGELSLIPNVNEARAYTLRYVLRETAFPDNNDDALVFFRLLNDQVDLSVEKTSFEVEIYEGDEFEYEITVRNIGGTPATNVEIVDELPASVTYLSSSVVFTNDEQIQVGTPAVTGSRITWNVPFLPADGVIVFRVRVQAGDAGTITNIATVGAEEEDVDTTNNQDDDVNQVLPFRIPNVITPNNDGDNDSFEIKGLGKFVSNEITIFNRYGDHVLEQENYRNDWNAPGQVSGTYFFVLRTVDRSGREHEFTGWIQVIKED